MPKLCEQWWVSFWGPFWSPFWGPFWDPFWAQFWRPFEVYFDWGPFWGSFWGPFQVCFEVRFDVRFESVLGSVLSTDQQISRVLKIKFLIRNISHFLMVHSENCIKYFLLLLVRNRHQRTMTIFKSSFNCKVYLDTLYFLYLFLSFV